VVPTEEKTQERRVRPGDPGQSLPRALVGVVGLAFIASLLVKYGFRIDSHTRNPFDWVTCAAAIVVALDLVIAFVRDPLRKQMVVRRRVEWGLLLLLGLLLPLVAEFATVEALAPVLEFTGVETVGGFLLAMVEAYVIFNFALRGARSQAHLLASGLPGEWLLVGSFLLLVVVGTLLLSLPGAHAQGARSFSWLDAFFTSTSASCVTGLVVRDTSTEFSTFGQVIVMGLFQIGGLGIITFVAFGSILSNKQFSVQAVSTLRKAMSLRKVSEVVASVWHVIFWVLAAEGAGCVLLFLFLPVADGTAFERFFWSLFHAISAFCNAGFSLEGSSLEGFRGAPGVNAVVMLLILIGGLGMPVARELLGFHLTQGPFFRRFAYFRRLHTGRVHKRISLQTRLSLVTTTVLLLVGFVGIWILESDATLASVGAGESALAAAFQSVTTRTAGFNTVPIGEMHEGTRMLMIALMAIGAGPVSTGGGIKTVTFAVLLVTLRAMVTGREGVEVAGRSLPRVIVRTAISVFVLYVLAAMTTMFVLSISDPEVDSGDRLFEAVSALSTVGLSTGITAGLSPAGKITLCLAMFVGRVGPLALTLSVFRSRRHAANYEFPEEELIVG
jgi:trk system potassium uptake protein TrkH